MIQLYYSAIFAEMMAILILLFKTPLRKLVVMSIDRLKRGTGPLVVKTVAGVVFLMMSITIYTITDINSRPLELLNPTDQIIQGRAMLEASLMGFMLFMLLMVDRLHHYIRELRLLRKAMEAIKTQNHGGDEGKGLNPEEIKVLGEQVSTLKGKIKQLESESTEKGKEVKAAEAGAAAQKNQIEDLLLDYDRLLKENQSLGEKLQLPLDKTVKKNT
ncbi:uncharacterized protein LOC124936903 [Impatiens glandulifera]|uniref:uncharacterized protein LOC124936903 n=1 Tax=Impatiens glandulifera TaxID=253017 RepID=UPI001FB08A50|nr:uncharacterized protein LOC124936903 [Impatiens glandulifera]